LGIVGDLSRCRHKLGDLGGDKHNISDLGKKLTLHVSDSGKMTMTAVVWPTF